jgi:nitric oxide reductase NorD protein
MARSLSDPQQSLIASLADQPEIAGTLELVWRQARASLPPALLGDWVAACRDISARIGPNAAIAYIRNSPSVAAAAGPQAVMALAALAPDFAALAGNNATLALFVAAPQAARRLATAHAFAEWLRVISRIAETAPESVGLLLDRSARVLDSLDLRSFETWALGGIRAAENDPERRLKFFALLDTRALHALEHGADSVAFTDVERELKAFVGALWRTTPPIRVLPPAGFDTPRRACFANGVIRVPRSSRGVDGQSGRDLFRATLAHVLAHFEFTGGKFALGALKPVQIALVSLIEDARVERLAIGRFPGLRRFWLPFHLADASGVVTAPALMARLARALLDPSYFDPHGWVKKGRDLFLAERVRWTDPAISRSIGGLLGNDLGQMRAQFDLRTYVVEPAYRDDNQGLWDFPAEAVAAAGETLYESVRFEQSESDPPDRERQASGGGAANSARLVPEDKEVGIPVARYPEWDYLINRDRGEWTTVLEYSPADGRVEQINAILERYPETAYRIAALVRAAKVSRPMRVHRQREGDRFDLEATIAAAIDLRAGLTPNPNVYARLERRWRDLAVLVLIDASQSTNDIVKAAGRSVLELERDATSLLAHAMDGMGDPFAIHAFCSDTREDVHYYRIKDFDTLWGTLAKRRLAGVTGRFSTRMGAALRHAGRDLVACQSYRKLLLLVSDGEPSDIDIADRRYLVEDARRAVLALQHQGVDVFCVGLEAGGDSYLTRIFGRSNVIQLDRIERLPEKLPLLYFRLAG